MATNPAIYSRVMDGFLGEGRLESDGHGTISRFVSLVCTLAIHRGIAIRLLLKERMDVRRMVLDFEPIRKPKTRSTVENRDWHCMLELRSRFAFLLEF